MHNICHGKNVFEDGFVSISMWNIERYNEHEFPSISTSIDFICCQFCDTAQETRSILQCFIEQSRNTTQNFTPTATRYLATVQDFYNLCPTESHFDMLSLDAQERNAFTDKSLEQKLD